VINYACREFMANAILKRSRLGYNIDCYPSDYKFKKRAKTFLVRIYGEKCMCCGAVEKIEIDHIKPVSKFPHLRFSYDNTQLLCKSCNSRKGNRKNTNYRKDSELLDYMSAVWRDIYEE
jgi:5-methylcytosine-specific restriction endonuclease McrA